jgi:5-methylcytosine-specific restriction endonuclease McrBC regulatory subunit McrC
MKYEDYILTLLAQKRESEWEPEPLYLEDYYIRDEDKSPEDLDKDLPIRVVIIDI